MYPSSGSRYNFSTGGIQIVSSLLLIVATTSTLFLIVSSPTSCHANPQDPLTEDELLSSLLGEDDSPPLSQENGVTILGTGAVDAATTLDCHRRLYSYRVTKADSTGKKCWDNVNVMSCWGRCDSNEIADWKFPYKRSHHPVCLYGTRKANFALLSNCDPDVEPGTERYDYQEAETCLCSVCKSSEASCEGLRYRGIRSGFGI